MCTDSSLLPNVDKLRFASTVQDYSAYTAHDGRDPGGSIQVTADEDEDADDDDISCHVLTLTHIDTQFASKITLPLVSLLPYKYFYRQLKHMTHSKLLVVNQQVSDDICTFLHSLLPSFFPACLPLLTGCYRSETPPGSTNALQEARWISPSIYLRSHHISFHEGSVGTAQQRVLSSIDLLTYILYNSLESSFVSSDMR